jgi:hypothetical protein
MAARKGPASLWPRCTRSGSSLAAIPVYQGRQCCILRGPNGESILDVVPRGTGPEPFGIRWEVWGGCTHSAIITMSSV